MRPLSPLNVPRVAPPADLAQPPADAVRTPSSIDPRHVLLSKVVTAGIGAAHPRAVDVVTAHYTAWATDGTTVVDSRTRGKPAVWIPNQLMEGLSSGIQLMVVGEKRRLWIHGAMGHEWATDMLVYDVELLAIAPAPAGPTHHEISTPPAGVTRTSSGLGFSVIRAGTGSERPKPTSTVTIHYTAWTTAGTELFDDSVARDTPVTVAVDALIAGLTEGLQRMVIGEKTRFWIPAELAYAAPMPRAAVVIDVELVAIQRAVAGPPGTVRVHSNSPDAVYTLILPDGTPREGKGPRAFPDAAPGHYRIKPAALPLYTSALAASPADMTLAPGGNLDITLNYLPSAQ